MIKEKDLIMASKVLSNVFSPFFVPFLGFVVLFVFSYLNMLPLAFKLLVLFMVYCFTVMLPRFIIFIYRKMNGWSSRQLGSREKRFVPYAIAFTSYVSCLLLMFRLSLPLYMCGIIEAALMVIIICSVINIWWKISTHMAGMGGLVGGLLSFSLLFGYNPVWWLCVSLLISGALGTSRIILLRHSVTQIAAGFVVGMLCSFIGILFM